MKLKKNILVSPLNWGIGHATRCIPIIKKLQEHNFNVIIASSGRSLDLLIQEFPNLDFIKINDYNIKYYSSIPMTISMLIQIPKILFNIQKENNQLKGIINDFKIDGIISDNRYGMYSNDIPSVFITHQLEIQTPIFKNFIKKINNKLISRFSECWIPDFEINGIAGKLSRLTNTTKNYKYIGPLSRFVNKKSEIKYDILAIISGPEPQRSILEKTLINELKILKKKSLLLQGKPEKKYTDKINNLTIKSHLSSEELNLAMLESRLIICRSGYSTVMDLFKLQKNAILIPTPGQTEQEYLSEFLSKSNYFKSINQNQIKFKNLITKTQKFQKIKKRDEETNWNSVLNIFNK
jgi:uncharacterized protein (TIGR00661 family)